MFCVPAARRETRPWRQQERRGSREDRTLSHVEVTIPAHIGTLEFTIPAQIAERLEESTRAITSLDASSGSVLNGLSAVLLRTESVASSKIEGIHATVDDYARALHGTRSNASASAMVAASSAMESLVTEVKHGSAITLNSLLRAHRILMSGDVSEATYAGRVRDMQNWIGGSDYSPRGALLVPPPPDLLADLMADFLTFVGRTDLPSLFQATVAHAQFESVHPFTDGNGRIGRALINAILRVRGITSTVVVPIASALVAQRDSYFAALDAYRSGDLEPIVNLFARAALIASEESGVSASHIRELSQQWRTALGRTREGSAPLVLLQHLATQPVLSSNEAERVLGAGSSVAHAAIDRLRNAGIVRPLTERKRNQIWGAGALLDELDDLDLRIQVRARSAD